MRNKSTPPLLLPMQIERIDEHNLPELEQTLKSGVKSKLTCLLAYLAGRAFALQELGFDTRKGLQQKRERERESSRTAGKFGDLMRKTSV